MQVIEHGMTPGSVGTQNQVAFFVGQVGEVKQYAQHSVAKMQGTVDSVARERHDDRLYFEQLIEGLRAELGQVKAENAALKKGLDEQKKILDSRQNACPPSLSMPLVPSAPPKPSRQSAPLFGWVRQIPSLWLSRELTLPWLGTGPLIPLRPPQVKIGPWGRKCGRKWGRP